MAASLDPPTRIGGSGLPSGRGAVWTSSNERKRLRCETTSLVQDFSMISRYSFASAPRCSKGTPQRRELLLRPTHADAQDEAPAAQLDVGDAAGSGWSCPARSW